MKFEDIVKFHGHSCPGLALGYKVALTALEQLNIKKRAEDEEIVCIVENDSCAVDAIQFITGCTFGKGNLIFKDYGKQVYTFIIREKGKAVRIAVDFEFKESKKEQEIWQKFMEGDRTQEVLNFIKKIKAEKIKKILNADKKDIFKITFPDITPPKQARIFKTLRCENCGEKVAETKVRILNGQTLCIPCFESLL